MATEWTDEQGTVVAVTSAGEAGEGRRLHIVSPKWNDASVLMSELGERVTPAELIATVGRRRQGRYP